MIGRRALVAGLAGLSIAGAVSVAPSRAAEPVYTGLVSGVGAGGYDVVAYQAEGKARPGSDGLTARHDGVTYRFAEPANRDAFAADPGRFLPAYGGYCAWAVANGYTAKGDPEAWSVVDGRLYLNYSKSVRSQWRRDVSGNIAKGNANWPGVLD